MTQVNTFYGGARAESHMVVSPSVEPWDILSLRCRIGNDGQELSRQNDYHYQLWPFDIDYRANQLMADGVPVTCRWEWKIGFDKRDGGGGVLCVSGTDHKRVRKVFTDRRALYMTDPAARLERKASGIVPAR
jgi:hypothetical protein